MALDDPGWPQETSNENGKMVIHQPQVDKWEDYLRLEARVAVVVTPAGQDDPVLGAIRISAETQTDHESRTVLIYNKNIIEARYPALDSVQSVEMTKLVESLMEPNPQLYALDRILASLEQTEMAVREVEVAVEPPLIFASEVPAVLVQFDGNPIFGPIEDVKLEFAVNTNWDIILDPGDSTYYLLKDSTWLRASAYDGPYISVTELPSSFSKIPETEDWAPVRSNIPGKKVGSDDLPAIFVTTSPAELIVTEGDPDLEQIPGTEIWWVIDTDSDLFLHGGDNNYYFLVSGRWFRAGVLEGPWANVSGDLPADFLAIPEDHPMAHVLVSVTGTSQADEAVLQSQVPQQASVNRDSVTLEVTYQGEPEFEPVETTEMYYAVNTPYTVILSGSSYYACHNAVWFISGSPNGPWVVCASVPSVIYTVPPSCPVHHVTYVYVYDSSPTVVVFGYTSGYHGVYVSHGCVVYGTGYYYHPYIYYGPYYPVYYPHHHHSYGVSAYYNPHTGTYARGAAVYGPHGGYGRGAAYNPHTGTYARGASAWGPYGGTTVAAAHNPYTGGRARTKQSYNSYSHWGESVVSRGDKWAHTAHYSDSRGTVVGYETSEGNKGLIVGGDEGRGVIKKSPDDDLYVGKDGEVYKRGDEGWSKYKDGEWSEPEKPDRGASIDENRADKSAGTTGRETRSGERDRPAKSQVEPPKNQTKRQGQQQWGVSKDSYRRQDLERSASARAQGDRRVSEMKVNRNRSTNTKARSGGRSRGGRRR
jgi:hypothetical protein